MISEPTKTFIRQHANDNTMELLLARGRFPQVDMPFAVQQIEGRRKTRAKLPELSGNDDFVFPPQLNLEQASSEQTARFKAHRYAFGKDVIDITGGFGIDTIYMSRVARSVIYIEQNPKLFGIAEENFKALGLSNVRCFCENSTELLAGGGFRADLIYADPARRDSHGRRMVSIADCTPDMSELLPYLFGVAPQVLIKTSPMLDIALAKRELCHVNETAVVSVRNECKELLFVCGAKADEGGTVVCADIDSGGTERLFVATENETSTPPKIAAVIGQYLYDPGVAAVKARQTDALSNHYELPLLHLGSRLCTSNRYVEDYMGRVFRVAAVLPVSAKEVRASLPGGTANVVCRNFPQTADELRRKFKIADGGEDFLIATTLNGGKKALVLCRRVG